MGKLCRILCKLRHFSFPQEKVVAKKAQERKETMAFMTCVLGSSFTTCFEFANLLAFPIWEGARNFQRMQRVWNAVLLRINYEIFFVSPVDKLIRGIPRAGECKWVATNQLQRKNTNHVQFIKFFKHAHFLSRKCVIRQRMHVRIVPFYPVAGSGSIHAPPKVRLIGNIALHIAFICSGPYYEYEEEDGRAKANNEIERHGTKPERRWIWMPGFGTRMEREDKTKKVLATFASIE